MEIRPATIDDARSIAEVQVRSWQAAYAGIVPQPYLDALSVEEKTAEWESHLRDAVPGGIAVATGGGPVVGFIALSPSRDADATATTAEIASLYVLPEVWRAGTGRSLIAYGIGALTTVGAADVTLWVLADNVRGRAFYDAERWRLDGTTRQEHTGDAALDEVRYRRRLT